MKICSYAAALFITLSLIGCETLPNNGQGSHTAPNGDRYVGDFKSGAFNGKGTAYFIDGDTYTGEWLNGEMSGQGTFIFKNGGRYVGQFSGNKFNGYGTIEDQQGEKYSGNFKDNKPEGMGTFSKRGEYTYTGEFRNGKKHGLGRQVFESGKVNEGVFENDIFIKSKQLASNGKENGIENSAMSRQKALDLVVSNTSPTDDGNFFISINIGRETASLKINGQEQGASASGKYNIRLIAKVGQSSSFKIDATDSFGNIGTKSITVSRQVIESKVIYAGLNPNKIKRQPERDAVAIVIGITDYRSLPKAEYANDDARVFYDYAIRALGLKPENIKLLVDGDAEEAEILKAFRTWLPSRVKSTTDVYVYYSGHGLPTPDGKGLYLLPPRADREVIDDTAIPFSKINAVLQLAKPRSVTIFMDACYSGQARSGETLLASARPLSLRIENRLFPDSFTVITASQHDQISSSSPELKHGIFSYYLMLGMEGDADANKDGKITLGEMQAYLAENVGRQAAMMSRKQEPQLIGDANRVLVGR